MEIIAPRMTVQQTIRDERHRAHRAGIPRRGRDSNSMKAWKKAKANKTTGYQLDYPEYSKIIYDSGLHDEDDSSEKSSTVFDINDMGDIFSTFSKASDDLKISFGMDQPTSIIGPNPNGTFGPTWNQLDDVDSEELKLLKSVYGVVSREELVKKLQEKAGLRQKTIHPLQLQRQTSFMNNLTQNPYPCDWSKYVIPTQGYMKKSH